MAAATSTASADREKKEKNQNQQIANEIKEKVKTELGLTTVPNTPPPGTPWSSNDSATSTYAANLSGNNMFMYGDEASAATKKYMDKAGLGTYNPDTGSFQNIVGNQIISNANSIMYGNSGGAMGSGDPSGVMSSIPLSKKMLESQNKTKALAVGALSLAMPGIGGTLMRLDAGK